MIQDIFDSIEIAHIFQFFHVVSIYNRVMMSCCISQKCIRIFKHNTASRPAGSSGKLIIRIFLIVIHTACSFSNCRMKSESIVVSSQTKQSDCPVALKFKLNTGASGISVQIWFCHSLVRHKLWNRPQTVSSAVCHRYRTRTTVKKVDNPFFCIKPGNIRKHHRSMRQFFLLSSTGAKL